LKQLLLVSVLMLVTIFAGCAKLNEPAKNADILNIEHIYRSEGYAMDTFVTDQHIYIAEDQAGFSIYDRNSDSLLTQYYGDIENARLIAAVEEDSILFVYDIYGSPAAIMVYDIVDPSNPIIKPNITGQTGDIEEFRCIPSESNEISLMWTRASNLRYGTYKTDDAIPWIGSYSFNFPNAVKGFDYDSTYYYIAGDERGMYVVDRTTGDLISSVDTSGKARAVKLIGDYVYIAAREDGLQVVDISNREQPILVHQYDTSGYAQGIDAEGDYLAIASGGGGIYLFDITNPYKPVYKDRIDNQIIGYTYNVIVRDDKLFVSTRNGAYELSIKD